MAKILVLGGGFGGVVAAESIANQLGNEHQITLVARSDRFVFYPALVSLAFGKCSLDDASFDLRKSMLSRNINFIEAEVARLDLERRKVVTALGEVEGTIPYDYLVFALGRRLATERTPGFFEHSHHLLDPEGALKFGEAVRNFSSGDVVLGQCSGARLPVPVYETAFALAKRRKENATRITVVSPTSLESEFGDANVAQQLETALRRNRVEYLPHFPVDCIERDRIISRDGRALKYDLLMLLPAFSGAPAVSRLGISSDNGYLNVDERMKVIGVEGMYAVGDCINLTGPKLGHMAVRQAKVAAANLLAEIDGREALARYNHEETMIIDATDGDTLYIHKDFASDGSSSVRQGRFWGWAKRAQEKYWETMHV